MAEYVNGYGVEPASDSPMRLEQQKEKAHEVAATIHSQGADTQGLRVRHLPTPWSLLCETAQGDLSVARIPLSVRRTGA